MIVGQVGSGKSSIISAILGEMTTMSGSVLFNRFVILSNVLVQMLLLPF